MNFGEGKGKATGSSDPMSFTLLRSGLWTKLGVNLSGKDYSHQTLRITWMHLPSYTEIAPKLFDPSDYGGGGGVNRKLDSFCKEH